MKKDFFLKLIPPRKTFMQDMSDSEKSIMQKHVAYWSPFINNGIVLVLGPVMDVNGGYGIAVVRVDSDEHLNELIAGDPAIAICSYEIQPMRAVTKQI